MLRPFPHGPGRRYQPGQNLGRPPAPTPSDAVPISKPETQPCSQSEEPAAAWFQRPQGSPYGPGWFGPRPNPPAPAPQPGSTMPPLAPGALPPPVAVLELAAAYVPFQQFTTIFAPGELPAPGTIFPELLRTPPLYRWPPCTDGRV